MFEPLVFLLQIEDLFIESMMFSAFMGIDHHPVGAKDDVIGDPCG